MDGCLQAGSTMVTAAIARLPERRRVRSVRMARARKTSASAAPRVDKWLALSSTG